MSGTQIHIRVRVSRLTAALALASGMLTIASVALGVGQAPAGASGCGMSLGAPQVQGAAGQFRLYGPSWTPLGSTSQRCRQSGSMRRIYMTVPPDRHSGATTPTLSRVRADRAGSSPSQCATARSQ
jgi:hypothetical protein